MINRHIGRVLGAGSALALMSGLASAHTGSGTAIGFVTGFMHPLGGIDHLSVMVAVGFLGVLLGGRAVWAVPLSFLSFMIGGSALGAAGIAVPGVEGGIILSMIAFAMAMVLHRHVNTGLAMALAGVFAIFHGHAHGAEMPQALSGWSYGVGFVAATAALHAAGLTLGRLPTVARLIGAEAKAER